MNNQPTLIPSTVLRMTPFVIAGSQITTLVIRGALQAISVTWMPALSYKSFTLLSLQATGWPMVAFIIASIICNYLWPLGGESTDYNTTTLFAGFASLIFAGDKSFFLLSVIGLVGGGALTLTVPKIRNFVLGKTEA